MNENDREMRHIHKYRKCVEISSIGKTITDNANEFMGIYEQEAYKPLVLNSLLHNIYMSTRRLAKLVDLEVES